MSLMRLSAKLDRTDSGTPWGFRMTGGKDFGAPLVVQRVTPGSLAAKCGMMVGDAIVRIGATPTDSLRHNDAQQRIIESGNALELALERAGSGHGGYTDDYGYAPSPPVHSSYPGGSAAPYSAGPKPYADSYNAVSSMTSHTASLSIGSPHSGTVDTDTTGMLHADETSLHDDARRLPDAAADVEASAAAISELPPHIKSDTPVVSQTKSAVYEEPGEDGRPHYRGFQDPNSQSQTFKRLQSLIESGEDVTTLATQRSASPVQVVAASTTVTKSAIATKPTLAPKPKDDSQPVVKCDSTVRQADAG